MCCCVLTHNCVCPFKISVNIPFKHLSYTLYCSFCHPVSNALDRDAIFQRVSLYVLVSLYKCTHNRVNTQKQTSKKAKPLSTHKRLRTVSFVRHHSLSLSLFISVLDTTQQRVFLKCFAQWIYIYIHYDESLSCFHLSLAQEPSLDQLQQRKRPPIMLLINIMKP